MKAKKQKIIAFNKKAFEGVVVGCLEVSLAPIDNIIRCSYFHGQRFNRQNAVAPVVYWHAGYMLCMCMICPEMEKRAFYLHIPFLCAARMPNYKDTVLVPNLKPETSIPVIKVVPQLLRDVFSEVLAKEVEKEVEAYG